MIGVMSDAHGNHLTIKLVCDYFFSKGIEKLFFLGDAVGYIPSLSVVDYLITIQDRVTCIRGNHEVMLLTGSYPSRLEDVYMMKPLVEAASYSQKSFLESWPQSVEEHYLAGKVSYIHGSPNDLLNGYVYPDSSLEQFEPDCDFVFMGHTHRPFIRHEAGTTYVNVGSCGLPRDDGRYVSAAIFDENSGDVEIIRLGVPERPVRALLGEHGAHASVLGLLDRRSENLVGNIVSG